MTHDPQNRTPDAGRLVGPGREVRPAGGKEGGSAGPCVVGPHKMGPVDPMCIECRLGRTRSSGDLPIRGSGVRAARVGELAYIGGSNVRRCW